MNAEWWPRPHFKVAGGSSTLDHQFQVMQLTNASQNLFYQQAKLEPVSEDA
jgi:hypothetical protein